VIKGLMSQGGSLEMVKGAGRSNSVASVSVPEAQESPVEQNVQMQNEPTEQVRMSNVGRSLIKAAVSFSALAMQAQLDSQLPQQSPSKSNESKNEPAQMFQQIMQQLTQGQG
jgi:hypothetical protein